MPQNTVYRIKVDLSVRPTICPPRNQPVALKSRIKEELDRMEQMKVIKKVEEPTDWVNAMVVVEKPRTKKLRICLDPRPLNKVTINCLPGIEDISTRLTGAKVFSKLDASHGYWQVPLDEESQLLTTFNSPFGRYCYTRMPFGIKSAQEIVQKRMHQNFEDLAGVETDIDNILSLSVGKKRRGTSPTSKGSPAKMQRNQSQIEHGEMPVCNAPSHISGTHNKCSRDCTR